jgi:hypothetical protein
MSVEAMSLHEGQAAFVPSGADHRFIGYEGLSVLDIFSRQRESASFAERQRLPHPL